MTGENRNNFPALSTHITADFIYFDVGKQSTQIPIAPIKELRQIPKSAQQKAGVESIVMHPSHLFL